MSAAKSFYQSIPKPGYGIGTKWAAAKRGRNAEEKGNIDQALVSAIAKAAEIGYRHFDAAEGMSFNKI